jgi:hypothetical protein
MSSTTDQPVTIDCRGRLTDEEGEAQPGDPGLWSYILRDPKGKVFRRGHGFTRKACQRQGKLHASGHPEALSILSAIIRCNPHDHGFWRFVVSPPSSKPQGGQRSKAIRPSPPQIELLMLGLANRLSRYSMGWCCDDGIPEGAYVRMFSAAIVSALWKRGLLAANCADPSLRFRELSNTRILDGASRFQVWTNDAGIQCLQNEGMLVLRDG